MRYLLTFVMLVYATLLQAQDSLLTLDKAITIALENNYDVRIQRSILQQDINNNTVGNAGMLPEAGVDAGYTKSRNSLNQKYSSGLEVNRDASESTNLFVDAGVAWTIFDGLKMFYAKDRLSGLAMQSETLLKLQMETSVEEIVSAYYGVVRNIQLLRSMQEEILLSQERTAIAERKMKNGLGSKLDWLQAKTEENRQRSLELNLQSDAEAARIRLNKLLGRNIETGFTVEDTVAVDYRPVFDDLKRTVVENNHSLAYYKMNANLAETGLKEIKSLRLPVVRVEGHYLYSKTTNEAGFSLLNRTKGFNYGATATWTLFGGFNVNRQVKNARLDLTIANDQYESVRLGIDEELFNAWRAFNNNMQLLKMEEENIVFAREVLTIAQERYRVGLSNAVEQREAQRTYEDAMTRLVDARYQAKLSETALRRLNGDLIK